MYALFITNKVKKEIKKVPKQPLNRIYEAIESLKKEPRPKGALKIKGNEGYRLRVGDYRILYAVNDHDQVVYIYRVKSRGAVYK
ncbi:MAG: type II toxin-antitoxin system mRNA interferase toxin, RelE/StbE family [Candidatus Methanogaster sp.]|uniref:Type II toxin-antitoxin system mRNA interferase toxin, RelE/StbE family n=1 Tax=Candidatus Methanogaster sp. TaxID=3386292 RepID=A0AC61L533_9EURY|nr:MAG: type II toxin-antitoxin system mRNA interferase toxin, RelE/StbE family [ANME-2 cluster archaeon]